jgi:hypothetical protein
MRKNKLYFILLFVFPLSFIACASTTPQIQDDICNYYKYVSVLLDVYCNDTIRSTLSKKDKEQIILNFYSIEKTLRKDSKIDDLAKQLKKQLRQP